MHLVFTGGTIDSFAPKEIKSLIPHYLNSLYLPQTFQTTFLFKKPSPQITDQDRAQITNFLDQIPETKILLFHGTDTLDQTLAYLTRHRKRKDQTVLLVGSMIPFGKEILSDAPFNLGFAYAMVHVLPPGVHVAMNGQLFQSPCIKKNFDLLRFEKTC